MTYNDLEHIPHRRIAPDEDEATGRLGEQYRERSELIALTGRRAAHIALAMERFTTEDDPLNSDTIELQPDGHTPLADALQAFLMLFTDPKDPIDGHIENSDIAKLLYVWGHEERGDSGAVAGRVRQFTSGAQTLLPQLPTEILEAQSDKLWTVLGAMYGHLGEYSAADDDMDEWFATQSAWDPDLARLIARRAAKVNVGFIKYTAQGNLFGDYMLELEQLEQSPLGLELQKLLMFFTNPERPEIESIKGIRLVRLLMAWDNEMDGDYDGVVERLKQFTHKAYASTVPRLRAELPVWSEAMTEPDKFWWALGATLGSTKAVGSSRAS